MRVGRVFGESRGYREACWHTLHLQCVCRLTSQESLSCLVPVPDHAGTMPKSASQSNRQVQIGSPQSAGICSLANLLFECWIPLWQGSLIKIPISMRPHIYPVSLAASVPCSIRLWASFAKRNIGFLFSPLCICFLLHTPSNRFQAPRQTWLKRWVCHSIFGSFINITANLNICSCHLFFYSLPSLF